MPLVCYFSRIHRELGIKIHADQAGKKQDGPTDAKALRPGGHSRGLCSRHRLCPNHEVCVCAADTGGGGGGGGDFPGEEGGAEGGEDAVDDLGGEEGGEEGGADLGGEEIDFEEPAEEPEV